MPTSRAIGETGSLEEERRLMYVAITRAKEKLWLTRSRSRFLYGRREPSARSRFVEELKGVLELPERAPAPSARSFSRDFSGYSAGFSPNGGPIVRKSYRGSGKPAEEEGLRTFGGSKTPVRSGVAGMSAMKPPQMPAKDTSGFRVGVRVKHARFGEGTVLAVRGEGKNSIITVHFSTVGNKDLAAALAPLEILS